MTAARSPLSRCQEAAIVARVTCELPGRSDITLSDMNLFTAEVAVKDYENNSFTVNIMELQFHNSLLT